jgi:DNA-binding NarL/FixJ family response regulator
LSRRVWGFSGSDHVATILLKLGVHSRLQAVVFAARYGAGQP